ncbi:MAG TPA: hypothetical protein VG206_02775 [Terriglobia bacterium]|nr:hypothetical protein [Terriglobia bacterium]
MSARSRERDKLRKESRLAKEPKGVDWISFTDRQQAVGRVRAAFEHGLRAQGVGQRELESAYVNKSKYQQERIESFRPKIMAGVMEYEIPNAWEGRSVL